MITIKYRVFRKMCVCFFPFLFQYESPPASRRANHVCMRSPCTVTPIGCTSFVQPIAVYCWRGRVHKIMKINGEKIQFFPERPVSYNHDIKRFVSRESSQDFKKIWKNLSLQEEIKEREKNVSVSNRLSVGKLSYWTYENSDGLGINALRSLRAYK